MRFVAQRTILPPWLYNITFTLSGAIFGITDAYHKNQAAWGLKFQGSTHSQPLQLHRKSRVFYIPIKGSSVMFLRPKLQQSNDLKTFLDYGWYSDWVSKAWRKEPRKKKLSFKKVLLRNKPRYPWR